MSIIGVKKRLHSFKDIVHHIDGDKLNNDPDNLLLTDRAGHQRIHNRNRNEKGQFI